MNLSPMEPAVDGFLKPVSFESKRVSRDWGYNSLGSSRYLGLADP